MNQDHGARTGSWTELVRRARLQPDLKLAALTLASYANAHGRGIVCSVSRLAVDCDVSYGTARGYFAALRKCGLIEVTKRGNRRRKQTDEYRLTIAEDLLARVDLPNGEQYKRLIGERTAAENKGTAERARQYRARKKAAANNADTEADSQRYSAVDNSSEDVEEAETITLEPGAVVALLPGITLDSSRNNAEPTASDLRVSRAHLPYIDPARTSNLPSMTEQVSLQRPGTSGPQETTRTDLDEVANGFADALEEARAALSALEDRGVALRALVRAELGADAPPDEVIMLAYERARRRSA